MGDKNSEVVEELTEVQQELSTETNLEVSTNNNLNNVVIIVLLHKYTKSGQKFMY